MPHENGTDLAEMASHVLNSTLDHKEICLFVERMRLEHRTLQQSFTRLCYEWLRHLSSLKENHYDARNAASVQFARKVMEVAGDHGFPTI